MAETRVFDQPVRFTSYVWIGTARFHWDGTALETAKEIRIASIGGNPALFGVNNTDPSMRAFATDSGSDTYNRFTINVNGEHRWGLGVTDLDTLFYRTAAGELTAYSITAVDAMLGASSAAGTSRGLHMKTANESRWKLFANSVAESGANAGSDLDIARYDDDGVYLGTALSIQRSGGTLSVTGAVVIGTGLYTGATDFLHHTTASLANGAAAQTGTLTNAPLAGNPTKWIAIDDNGTTRHIPSW